MTAVIYPATLIRVNTISHTASELARRFGLELHGDGDTAVTGVATLAHAGPGQLSFLANPRYRSQLEGSQAGIVVLRAEDAAHAPHAALIARDPYTSYARISALFEKLPQRTAGIHPSAVIDPAAQVADNVHIGPFVSIGAGSVIVVDAPAGKLSVARGRQATIDGWQRPLKRS